MTLGRLDEFPRARLGGAETPLEPLPRLTAANTGAEIWAKRDDAQPLAFGGNKVRQVEFYMGEAQAQGADTVVITGAVQSNFCRVTAAFAAKLGMACHLQLEERVASNDPAYRNSGNVLVDKLLGAHLHSFPVGEDEAAADAGLEEIAEKVRADGGKPYIIHLGAGHPPVGALGYMVAAREILEQVGDGPMFDHVVVGSGSGSTHAGLLTGLRALGCNVPVIGVCVRRANSLQKPRIEARCADVAALLGIENPVKPEDVIVNDRFLGPGYGQLNLPTERAILMAARTEALMLDPVYTGKVMAGTLALAGNRPESERVLFMHTGGTPGIFGYGTKLEGALA